MRMRLSDPNNQPINRSERSFPPFIWAADAESFLYHVWGCKSYCSVDFSLPERDQSVHSMSVCVISYSMFRNVQKATVIL
jgi:hypothetical protein